MNNPVDTLRKLSATHRERIKKAKAMIENQVRVEEAARKVSQEIKTAKE